MAGKYDRLTSELRAAAARGQSTVELSFDDVAALVGGLPPSAGSRQWWANNTHVQALAWRAAGFHVASVSLDHRTVRFSLGPTGGSGRRPNPTAPKAEEPGFSSMPETSTGAAIGERVDVRVQVDWTDAGSVVLDTAGKPTFDALPAAPGLYRLTFTGRPGQARPRVYIGESDNLRRRLAGNYRNPGSSQQTSLRVNAALRQHLASRGRVDLVIATAATAHITSATRDPAPFALDLGGKAARLLAESAALVSALLADDVDLENLP